ncbi:MAG: amidohydrolase family protein [Alicyclobacillus sp.]|nr:amidohydrolase family protein [Alicyclobacillus sp.]
MHDFVQDIPLTDHHCHAIVGEDRKADVDAMLRATSEAPGDYPLLDLAARPIWHAVLEVVHRYTGQHSAALADWQALRAVLGQTDYAAYTQRLFHDAGYEALYVDTGFAPEGAPRPTQLAALTGVQVHPILRLERLAELEFRADRPFDDWWEGVSEHVRTARADGYVGGKSIAAYRCGLRLRAVSLAEARAAYRDWAASRKPRLTDERLIHFLVWNAAESLTAQSLPLQFHTGYGDPDTDLLLGNPLHLRTFIEAFTPRGLAVVLLHTYPYHREAGYLASVYPNVYFDTSLIVPLGLTAARRVVAEALELAPYTRFLFASDAHTRPELYFLAAELFRDALGHHLEDPQLGRFTGAQVRERWAQQVLRDNARTLYGLA